MAHHKGSTGGLGNEDRERGSNKRMRLDAAGSRAAQGRSDSKTQGLMIGTELGLSSEDEVETINRLHVDYDIQLHSVISSSKIQKKVASILRHFNAQRSTTRGSISILRSRASDAGKLMSISEIVKRELSRSPLRDADHGGQPSWFQYIALGEQVNEHPQHTLSSQSDGETLISDTMLGRPSLLGKSQELETTRGEGALATPRTEGQSDDDDDDDFEVMKTRFERAIEGQPRVRSTPIMNLFICSTSITELKQRYGEQSNPTGAES